MYELLVQPFQRNGAWYSVTTCTRCGANSWVIDPCAKTESVPDEWFKKTDLPLERCQCTPESLEPTKNNPLRVDKRAILIGVCLTIFAAVAYISYRYMP